MASLVDCPVFKAWMDLDKLKQIMKENNVQIKSGSDTIIRYFMFSDYARDIERLNDDSKIIQPPEGMSYTEMYSAFKANRENIKSSGYVVRIQPELEKKDLASNMFNLLTLYKVNVQSKLMDPNPAFCFVTQYD